MKPLRALIFASLLLVPLGCALLEPKEVTYLRSAQDRATQEEVRRQLGAPARTTSMEAGGSVWVYELRQQQPDSRMSPAGTWCDEYTLTFDNGAMLRRWTRQTKFHGGEFMPTWCVSSAVRPAS